MLESSTFLCLLPPLDRQPCLHLAIPRTSESKTTIAIGREDVQELEAVRGHKQARNLSLDVVEPVGGVVVRRGLQRNSSAGK